IGDHDIEHLRRHLLESLRAVRSHRYDVPDRLERFRQRLTQLGFVLDHQDPQSDLSGHALRAHLRTVSRPAILMTSATVLATKTTCTAAPPLDFGLRVGKLRR